MVNEINTLNATSLTLLVDQSHFNYPLDAHRSGSRSATASDPDHVPDRTEPHTIERGDFIVNDKRSQFAVGVVSASPDLAEESARTR